MSDFNVPDDCVYTEHDEWVRMEDDRAVVGISDYAQEQLGDIVFVELPEVGTPVTVNQPFGVIESVKAVSDLYAPITGEIAAINDSLNETPELVNEACYAAGWLIAIMPAQSNALEALMDAAAYKKSVDERSD